MKTDTEKLMKLVKTVGDVLTNLDTTLSQKEFTQKDPQWQQLYALRNRLDDQQRKLVTLAIDSKDDDYKSATNEIAEAQNEINAAISKPDKIIDMIQGVAKVTASMDDLFLAYREPRGRDRRGAGRSSGSQGSDEPESEPSDENAKI